ncbi:MAG: hypothetical protein QOJ44_885 [Acidimicrobiaceae bacterium]|jgi:hypothetical protein|nr:hypothetical protein [Acidimicrobiaceae bacterium]
MTEPGHQGAHPSSDPMESTSGFRLDGVSLIGDPRQAPETVDGLTLLFDAVGFVIVGPAPGASRRVEWSALAGVVVGLVVSGTDGGIATPLDVTSAGRTVRFLLPAGRVSQVQVSLLERRLLQWRGPEGRGGGPAWDTTAPGPWPLPGSWAQPAGGTAGPGPGSWPPPTGRPARSYGYPTMGPVHSGWAIQPIDHLAEHSRRRRRKFVGMSLSMLLVLVGVGIWVGLATTDQSSRSTTSNTRPSPDQQLAQNTMLAQTDLPSGWQVSPGGAGGTSAADQKAERQIAIAFQKCMGVTAEQATTALGGQSKDQTAQAQSPIYVGPTPGSAGAATELQSTSAVVRTHADETSDYAVYANPRFPQCNAVAGAASAQIGVNDGSGGHDKPGPAEGHVVAISPFPGEQLLEVESTFTLNSGGQPIVVQDYQILVASDRVEASLGAFAVGTVFPTDVLSASASTLEHRVASVGPGKGSA